MTNHEPTSLPTNAWAPYVPAADSPWNLRRVVHLHRRAGFGATWNELQRDLAEGPAASVDRLLSGKPRSDGVPGDFEHVAGLLADAAVASRDAARLKAWWLYRMLFTPDPLAERLALLWHNHFATSNLKVDDPAAMRRQNEHCRELARGKFGDLLRRLVHDPALLVWLDAPANRNEHPNENLGRELMELFTLGVGHYSETDVKEASRALTGWTVSQSGEFRDVADRHDEGEKTILGRTGKWRGDDLVEILLELPATAQRLARRLCEMFFGEEAVELSSRPPLPPLRKGGGDARAAPAERSPDAPTASSERSSATLPPLGRGGAGGVALRDAIAFLASGLRERHLDIGWAVETILRSQLFFADANLGCRISGPAEFVIGATRVLEQFNPPPGTLVLAEWTARLGQDLFYPPNVFGWPAGRAWITPRSMIGRANFASSLVRGGVGGRTEPLDVFGLLKSHGRQPTLDDTVDFCCEVVLGTSPSQPLQKQLAELRRTSPLNDPDTARRIAALILASPEAQL